ncbi:MULTISPECIES: flagellin [Campylobacter]|uniref:Flagellin n=1 Tax=Campylobacter vicugnae TaxID=1660076 RepID=A0ABZ2E9H6_9BACT|nr:MULTISPECIES: flagellin [unclassified Campylobacter]MCR8689335.1 flagellin [Campylobacter sp. RM9264]MCR8701057.1 flagellin [Campylobacter sp. RM12176]
MKIDNYSNSMQNYYLDNAKNSANKALDNISANRAISGSDSANMVIANALLSDANAISQGVSNANDAIGVLQIADGALQNLTDSADRLNELSIRSTSLAMDDNSRAAIKSEAQALKTSMQDTLNSTSFNGNNIFGSTLNFQTGSSETTISLNAPNISSIDIDSQESIAAFRDGINAMRGDIGSTQQGLLSDINASITAANSARSSESQLQNNDVVKNLSDLNKADLLLNSTTLTAAHNMTLLAQQVSTLLR